MSFRVESVGVEPQAVVDNQLGGFCCPYCMQAAPAAVRKRITWGWLLLAGFVLLCGGLLFYSCLPLHGGYSRLMDAIDRSDISEVSRLLRSGVDPNQAPSDFWSEMSENDGLPLQAACDKGDVEIVRLLLDHGADPNLRDGWESPLEAAAFYEHLEVMELLIQRGAKVNDEPGRSSALWSAALDGNVASLRFLLAHGADPNSSQVYHAEDGHEERTSLLQMVSKELPKSKARYLLIKAGARE